MKNENEIHKTLRTRGLSSATRYSKFIDTVVHFEAAVGEPHLGELFELPRHNLRKTGGKKRIRCGVGSVKKNDNS